MDDFYRDVKERSRLIGEQLAELEQKSHAKALYEEVISQTQRYESPLWEQLSLDSQENWVSAKRALFNGEVCIGVIIL